MGSYEEVKNAHEVVENCMKNKMKCLLFETQSQKQMQISFNELSVSTFKPTWIACP